MLLRQMLNDSHLAQTQRASSRLPVPEVIKLFGDDAERVWNAAFLKLYRAEERPYAPTAPAPLYDL